MLPLIGVLFVFLINRVGCYNIDVTHPIVYKFPSVKGRSSYFGMTVAVRPGSSKTKDSWALQVGAPRGNVTGVNVEEPGAVYRCNIFGPCKEFVVDRKGNTPGVNHYYHYKDRKNHAWTGVSMDLKSASNNVRTVICGNRWSNQNLTNDDNIGVTYLITGVCYLNDVCNCPEENQIHKLLPLVNPEKIYYPKPYSSEKSYYYWGLGQSGTSSILLDDLSSVIMGAPGYNNWLGTVIKYNIDVNGFDFRVGQFESTKEYKRNPYSYIGYQVSYGRFFSDKNLCFLAGAPRSENYHGKVIIFQFKGSTSQVQIISELTGSTFGEYFGSSLAVSDLNNDGFDDLVVGAPLFFHKYPEEGRIYVYLGTNRGNFLLRSQVINGRSGYSRFGSCVCNLDDLDQDGFRDIAVGAPYESNGHGAVYIFRGSKKGLEIEYSQRILAEKISHGLRGFGISLFGGVDVDENKYKDLAIGAYLSNDVILLRSQPIIHFHPAIRLEDITLLERKANSFNISMCLRYSGSNAPHHIRTLITAEVDTLRNRAFFIDSMKSTNKYELRLLLNEMKCQVLTIKINSESSNYEPMQAVLKAELPSCNSNKTDALFIWDENSQMKDRFDKWCPIGRKKETYIEIPFAGECGADNICQAELELHCKIPNLKETPYLVVNSEYITLSLELRNTGEPAHSTQIIIHSNMDLVSNDLEDGDTPKQTFYIDVGSTFMKNFHANFSFRIPTDSFTSNETAIWGRSHLIIRAEAITKSIEDFLGDNLCINKISLLSDATVDLYSSSTLTSAFDLKNTTELNFTLYYEIQKKGETPISDAEMRIYIPSYLEQGGKEIEITAIKVETSDWMYSSINDEGYHKWEGPSEVDERWQNLNLNNNSLPTGRTVFLNCSANEIRCRVVSVVFPDGIFPQISSHIKIFITLYLNAVGSLMNDKDIIHFTSTGILEYQKLFEVGRIQIFSHASVTFYKEEGQKKVESYVIALSVVGGGLLLFLIVSALVKFEFFRRKKKEELEALKTEELRRQSNYEFPPEIISESDLADGCLGSS